SGRGTEDRGGELRAHLVLAQLPQRNGEPAGPDSEKCAGNHVADKMEVGSDEADADDGHRERIEDAVSRIANPEDRRHRANRRHVAGGKSGEAWPAVKRVEAVDAVADERGIVAHPGFRPGSPEGEL